MDLANEGKLEGSGSMFDFPYYNVKLRIEDEVKEKMLT